MLYMLWYLGYGTRYLLMGHKLLVIDNKSIIIKMLSSGVDCLSCNDCVATSMFGCVH